MVTTVFTNGRVLFPGLWGNFVPTMVVEDDHIMHIGWDRDQAVVRVQATASTVDLKNRMVLPGFIDSHVHLLNFGLSLQKLDLLPCKNIAEIRNAINSYAATHPSDPRILCRGWVQSVTDGNAFTTALDDLDPRPIYIEAMDLHSTWCNNAALKELEAHSKPDPPGGKIHRFQNGMPSGLFEEAAQFDIVWPFLDRITSMEKKVAAIDAAVSWYYLLCAEGDTFRYHMLSMARSRNIWSPCTGTVTVYKPQHSTSVRAGLALYKDEHRFLAIGYDFHSKHVTFNGLNQAESFSQSETQGVELQDFISFKIGYTDFFRMDKADWHDLATVDTAIMTDYDFTGPVIGIFAIGDDVAVEFGDFEVDAA
ncbi:hypothetical protein VN97_g12513 [Penicillium thymicola]|uniref:Amidohydrolase 3 domain-containing protein n=1 Tax=Penicillium thymicola TaxID=293382 RepID=A0AAI9T674_PENTH|nr:hypothetical protein VN97_g12513 [Penicillium thymicola]